MRNLIFLGVLLLSLASCKKDEIDFTLKGKITDTTFGGGLSGATVTLTEVPVGSGVHKVVGTATLSADGTYSFTFLREKAEKYIVKVTKANYFTIESDITFSEFSPESDLVKDYSTTAKSWVRLRFVNQAPASTFDALKFNKVAGKTGCLECCVNDDHMLYGIVDTTFFCVNDANTTYSYYYLVEGTTNQGIESIVTTPFDTVTITKTY